MVVTLIQSCGSLARCVTCLPSAWVLVSCSVRLCFTPASPGVTPGGGGRECQVHAASENSKQRWRQLFSWPFNKALLLFMVLFQSIPYLFKHFLFPECKNFCCHSLVYRIFYRKTSNWAAGLQIDGCGRNTLLHLQTWCLQVDFPSWKCFPQGFCCCCGGPTLSSRPCYFPPAQTYQTQYT